MRGSPINIEAGQKYGRWTVVCHRIAQRRKARQLVYLRMRKRGRGKQRQLVIGQEPELRLPAGRKAAVAHNAQSAQVKTGRPLPHHEPARSAPAHRAAPD